MRLINSPAGDGVLAGQVSPGGGHRLTSCHGLQSVQCPQVYQADYQLTSDLSCQADRKLGWTVLGAGKCGTLDTWAIHSTQLWSAMSQVIGLTLI